MRRGVLADTGPLYAAVDVDDQNHASAQEDLERLQREGLAILVAFPILLESYSLVMRRVGLSTAHRWLRQVLDGAGLINPMQEDYLDAGTRVRAYPDQPLTLFDAVLAALSTRLEAPVWTYDYHFDLMRVQVWR
jgi:predicted nucleic acid-binding protein